MRKGFRSPIAGLCLVAILAEFAQAEDDFVGALWLGIRDALKRDGSDYFDHAMKDGEIPPLRGLVLSSDERDHPGILIVSLSGDSTPEATLKLDRRLKCPIPEGKAVSFSGVARAFTQSPFMLNFDVKARDVTVVPWKPPKRVQRQQWK